MAAVINDFCRSPLKVLTGLIAYLMCSQTHVLIAVYLWSEWVETIFVNLTHLLSQIRLEYGMVYKLFFRGYIPLAGEPFPC